MPTVFDSDQYALSVKATPSLIDATSWHGRLRVAYFSKTLPASGLAIADSIRLCKIPKGARILGGTFRWDTAQGITATTAIGITGTTGKYFVAAVTNSTAVFQMADLNTTNYGEALAAEADIQALNAAAAWTVSSKISGNFLYVTD